MAIYIASLLLSPLVLADVTPGASQLSSSVNLKLARTYSGNNFFSGFDFFTAADPTNGYVNYVSQSDATSLGLISVGADNSVNMGVDAVNVATGRGRNSVRLTSKDQWADGVYILDLNHMPVGCGTWPAFWTTVLTGWPIGGEIDVIEGTNALPTPGGLAWNATKPNTPTTTTIGQNTASLHINGTCTLPVNYQLGTLGSNTCQASINGNMGCGVEVGGNATYGVDSFGSGFNAVGGYFALWRDFENSGGAYVWYWPRGSSHLPADVSNSSTQTTNVAGWGQPSANLSIPTCKTDFHNHNLVFNIALCGDYATPTFAASGCPGTCTTFVMNNPIAFAEAYWSIRSLRIYTATGQSAWSPSTGLSKGAIAGIAVGGAVALLLLVGGWWFWRKRRNARRASAATTPYVEDDDTPKPYALVPSHRSSDTPSPLPSPPLGSSGAFIPYLPSDGSNPDANSKQSGSTSSRKTITQTQTADGKRLVGINLIPKNPKGNVQANGYAREGKTKLAPGRSARHYLAGETPIGTGSGDVTPEEGTSRRGSLALPPSQSGGDWVKLAQGKNRQTQLTGGKPGWAG